MGRGDLTDEQWAVLEPLLPKGTKTGRPPVWPRRQLIDGIRFRVRTGVPWRDVPAEYGPWSRVYGPYSAGTPYFACAGGVSSGTLRVGAIGHCRCSGRCGGGKSWRR
ncbi:transposase [Streptomyces sp. NPDC013012]|uniref:transposase n=1 Tax=Streptomyces sp. NPDC013012 TaxID=3364860 RepID=UPI0036BB4A1E